MTEDEKKLMILRFCGCRNSGPEDYWDVIPITSQIPNYPFPITAYHTINFNKSWDWFYAAWKIAKKKILTHTQRKDQREDGITRNCSGLLDSIKQALYDGNINEAYELLVKLIQWYNMCQV